MDPVKEAEFIVNVAIPGAKALRRIKATAEDQRPGATCELDHEECKVLIKMISTAIQETRRDR